MVAAAGPVPVFGLTERTVVERFCGTCGWARGESFDLVGEGEHSWRNDGYRGSCRGCTQKLQSPGHPCIIYGIFRDSQLVYVGSTHACDMMVRHERAWIAAFRPDIGGYKMPLSAALRALPEPSQWVVRKLQECDASLRRQYEQAWMYRAAPPGRLYPILNARLEMVDRMCKWSEDGEKVALHLDQVPNIAPAVFKRLRRDDPEALKKMYRA